jgi:ubiquinone/menaquinone biosynthesis C-methylase UbiE
VTSGQAGSEVGLPAEPVDTELRRQYVKLCDVRDFDDPALSARIDDIVPGLDTMERLHRKKWEYAMLTLFLEDMGVLRDDARILSVGAGHETVLFWLANRVAKVVATDIYGQGSFSEQEADRTMLSDPASFSPYPYRESHLEVRHMDATELDFPDGSFDAVFTLSSIEHFGSWANIRRSAREIGRVLGPGGSAFVVTECFLGRSVLTHSVQEAGSRVTGGRVFGSMRVFTPETLLSEIVEPSGLQLVQPLDTTLSAATTQNVIELNSAGLVSSHTGAPYPHVVVRARRALGPVSVHTQKWTSAALAMVKPSG